VRAAIDGLFIALAFQFRIGEDRGAGYLHWVEVALGES